MGSTPQTDQDDTNNPMRSSLHLFGSGGPGELKRISRETDVAVQAAQNKGGDVVVRLDDLILDWKPR